MADAGLAINVVSPATATVIAVVRQYLASATIAPTVAAPLGVATGMPLQ